MPSVVDFLRDFRADLISEEQSQMRLMARHWLAVEDHLSSAIDQAAQAAANAAKNGQAVSQSQLFQLQRWNELLVATRAEIETYNQWAENQIVQQQQNIAAETMDRASTAIELAAADAGSVIGSFNTLPVEAVEFMIGNTADGSPLRQLMDKAWPEAADAMARILVQNTAAGINPRKTARAMMDQGLATGLNRLLNIARTEQLRVFREASREQYQASGVVRGYKRISARDDRVCPACLFSDGEFYEVDTPLDEHASGRCGMVPVVIGLPEPEWESGKDWFENQDEQTQRNILGPGAFNLWRENGFDLSAFVSRITNPIWGDSLQATSLASLRAQVGGLSARTSSRPSSSRTPATGGIPAALASAWQTAQSIATELGLDPKKLLFGGSGYSMVVNGQRARVAAEFDPNKKVVVLFENGLSSSKLAPLLAHEISHAQFQQVMSVIPRADRPETRAFRASLLDEALMSRLSSLGGVSSYSQHYWDLAHAETDELLIMAKIRIAINETLAEVAYLDRIYGGPDPSVPEDWRTLYNQLVSAYEEVK